MNEPYSIEDAEREQDVLRAEVARLTANVVKWQDLALKFAQERDEAQEARDALVEGLRNYVAGHPCAHTLRTSVNRHWMDCPDFDCAARLIEQYGKKEGT